MTGPIALTIAVIALIVIFTATYTFDNLFAYRRQDRFVAEYEGGAVRFVHSGLVLQVTDSGLNRWSKPLTDDTVYTPAPGTTYVYRPDDALTPRPQSPAERAQASNLRRAAWRWRRAMIFAAEVGLGSLLFLNQSPVWSVLAVLGAGAALPALLLYRHFRRLANGFEGGSVIDVRRRKDAFTYLPGVGTIIESNGFPASWYTAWSPSESLYTGTALNEASESQEVRA